MLNVRIKNGLGNSAVRELLTFITKLDIMYDIDTSIDGDMDIIIIEDYVDDSKIPIYNLISLQVIDKGISNITTVEEVGSTFTGSIITSNLAAYIAEVSSQLDRLILEQHNLNEEIELYEEDHTQDIEEELNNLQGVKEQQGEYLDRLYEYALRLGIEV